jgi:hypothetical protein
VKRVRFLGDSLLLASDLSRLDEIFHDKADKKSRIPTIR